MSKRVLCLIADGFEEMEVITPVDLLRRGGIEVIITSLGAGNQVTGRSGIIMQADAMFADIDISSFDLLLLPGGPQVVVLRADVRVPALVRIFANAEKTIAAICAAPLILHDAGLLNGKAYTAHDSTSTVLGQAQSDKRVVTDGNLITSRGAGTALEFGLTLLEHLAGAAESARVAKAIMA
jgi:4-methyl-5(b-hydroxyethyl)-thiazole monophosphate biosynthesis